MKQEQEIIVITLKRDSVLPINFKVFHDTPMLKIKEAFGKRLHVDPLAYRFMFNGQRIEDNDTAHTLQLEQYDCIDVFVEQTGGGIF